MSIVADKPVSNEGEVKRKGSSSGEVQETTNCGASPDGAPISSSSSAASSPSTESSSPLACDVAHVASVHVPCAACGTGDVGSSRLAFFDMAVPHFGK